MDFGIRKAGKQEKIFELGNFPAFLLSLFPFLPARCAAMKPEPARPVPAGTASLRLAFSIRRQPHSASQTGWRIRFVPVTVFVFQKVSSSEARYQLPRVSRILSHPGNPSLKTNSATRSK
jgi:hypothetical protein